MLVAIAVVLAILVWAGGSKQQAAVARCSNSGSNMNMMNDDE